MKNQGVYDWPNVRVLEGRWQDWFIGEKLGEVLEGTPDGSGFSAIFMDTFAEGYEGGFIFFYAGTKHLTYRDRSKSFL